MEGPKGLHTLHGGTEGFAHPLWRDQKACTPFVEGLKGLQTIMEDSRVLLAEKEDLFIDL